ncbi:MAG: 50S ribosomal protein L25/general stress protein Ctc [Pseudomonadota bacterium]
MSDNIHLNAEPRSDSGKGASRRLRHQGLVPAIVYGGENEPTNISIKHNEFFHQLENDAIYTQIIELQIGSEKEEVILRDLQRHPYKNKIMHADFFRFDKKKALNIVVPINVVNAEDCVGVKMEGGMLTQTITEVEVIALPKDIPEYLEIDAENLNLGETLHLSDLKMPEDVQLSAFMYIEEEEYDEYNLGVVSVVKTRAEEEEVEEDLEAADGEVAEGDAAEGDDSGGDAAEGDSEDDE